MVSLTCAFESNQSFQDDVLDEGYVDGFHRMDDVG